MPDDYLSLSPADRREALAVAASASGRPEHLLEKDVWVVWALDVLFSASIGEHLVFKGGTSLSKAYGAIRRFSEDVDLTYDIRALAPDLVGDSPNALPASRSQEVRWTKEARARLAAWSAKEAAPFLREALAVVEPAGEVREQDGDLFIRYAPLAAGTGYVRPEVKLEFGARATGEPNEIIAITCDAAAYVSGVAFPKAQPRVMLAERTFWEKATAAHVFCRQGRLRGERFARHWYDLVRLDDAGYAARALERSDLAKSVAGHKAMFFREKDASGSWIDYRTAVAGGLQLVPDGEARAALADDYGKMVEDGLLLDAAEPFEAVMEACASIADRANSA